MFRRHGSPESKSTVGLAQVGKAPAARMAVPNAEKVLPGDAEPSKLKEHSRGNESISRLRLAGDRNIAPLQLILFLDQSASFDPYHRLREQAVGEVYKWSTLNLVPGDSLGVIDFRSTARIRLECTPITMLRRHSFPPFRDQHLTQGTQIGSAFLVAANSRRINASQPVAVVCITDTEGYDTVESLRQARKRLGPRSVSVVIPRGVQVSTSWKQVFGMEGIYHCDSNSKDSVTTACARAIGFATGQIVIRN